MIKINTNVRGEAREHAAHRIFRSGSFQTDFKNGFEMAVHQKYPGAPRSPFYFNLRPEGVKGGTLTPADFQDFGSAFKELMLSREIWGLKWPIAAVPEAGVPFLDAIMHSFNILPGSWRSYGRFGLQKHLTEGRRHFSLDPDHPCLYDLKMTVLVDDLLTSAVTKLLAAEAIKASGGSVENIVVFLNRSASAADELRQHGINLHAVWEFDHLMEWALGRGYLKRSEYEQVIEYPDQLQNYLHSVGDE